MGKGLVSQVRGVWTSSGILQVRRGRFALKQAARDQIHAQGVGATSTRIAALTPISSYRTFDAYRAVADDFARFAQAQGVTRVRDLRPEHAEAYMLAKLAGGRSCNTLRTYSAALGKLDQALAGAPRSMRIPAEARLLPGLDSARIVCNRSAPRLDAERRAYANPQGLVEAVQGGGHRLAARLQLTAGFRVSEVMALRRSDLRGETVDPVLAVPAGLVHVVGKGGYERTQYVPLTEYRALAEHLAGHSGVMDIRYKPFLSDLHQAADGTGQAWTGSHGLRHNYVRAFIVRAAEAGLSSMAVMSEAMERVGHHRVSELKTYCR